MRCAVTTLENKMATVSNAVEVDNVKLDPKMFTVTSAKKLEK